LQEEDLVEHKARKILVEVVERADSELVQE
jgi:hypothetical protein